MIGDDVAGDHSRGGSPNRDAGLTLIIDWSSASHRIPGHLAGGIWPNAGDAHLAVVIKEVPIQEYVGCARQVALAKESSCADGRTSHIGDVRGLDLPGTVPIVDANISSDSWELASCKASRASVGDAPIDLKIAHGDPGRVIYQ